MKQLYNLLTTFLGWSGYPGEMLWLTNAGMFPAGQKVCSFWTDGDFAVTSHSSVSFHLHLFITVTSNGFSRTIFWCGWALRMIFLIFFATVGAQRYFLCCFCTAPPSHKGFNSPNIWPAEWGLASRNILSMKFLPVALSCVFPAMVFITA